MVGDGGFEPPTSSMSRKRSPPELIARAVYRGYSPRAAWCRGGDRNRTGVRGFAGLCLTTRPPRRVARQSIEGHPNGRLSAAAYKSGRRDSNPRPPPWQSGRARVYYLQRCPHTPSDLPVCLLKEPHRFASFRGTPRDQRGTGNSPPGRRMASRALPLSKLVESFPKLAPPALSPAPGSAAGARCRPGRSPRP